LPLTSSPAVACSHPSLRNSEGNNSRLGGASDGKAKISRVAKRKWSKKWNTLFPENTSVVGPEAKHGKVPILVHHDAGYVGGHRNNLIDGHQTNR